jgi:hypothetical protein
MNNPRNRVGVNCISAKFRQRLLSSLADIEGHSDLTRTELLLLISKPCNHMRGSCGNISDKAWECDAAIAG